MIGPLVPEPVELRILARQHRRQEGTGIRFEIVPQQLLLFAESLSLPAEEEVDQHADPGSEDKGEHPRQGGLRSPVLRDQEDGRDEGVQGERSGQDRRSEEHTSELQSLMRISYAVFCLKKNK